MPYLVLGGSSNPLTEEEAEAEKSEAAKVTRLAQWKCA